MSRYKFVMSAMSLGRSRPPKAAVQFAALLASLQVTGMAAISNYLRYLNLKKRCKIQANVPSLVLYSGPVHFDGSELMQQSSCCSLGGDYIKVLAAGFGAALTDIVQRPGSVPGLPDCGPWRVGQVLVFGCTFAFPLRVPPYA